MTTVTFTTATTPYTIYGAKAAGTPSLVRGGLILPASKWRVRDMPDADSVHGSEPVAKALQEGLLTLKVRLEAATEAAWQNAYQELEAVLAQWSFTATVDWGSGVTRAWRVRSGDLELTNGTRTQWPAGDPVVDWLTITLRVYPVAVA